MSRSEGMHSGQRGFIVMGSNFSYGEDITSRCGATTTATTATNHQGRILSLPHYRR